MEELISQLVQAIQARVIPVELELWDADGVAGYLKVQRRTVLEVFAPRPDFPAAIRLPTRGSGPGAPRWKAMDVIEWAQARQDKRRMAIERAY